MRDKVFATIKGKTTEIPDAVVMDGTTVDKVLVAVSDDSIQSKTPDFTYTMKTPLKAVPATGTKITLTGTYSSYTQKPLMILMDGGEEVREEGGSGEEGSGAAAVEGWLLGGRLPFGVAVSAFRR